MKMQLTDTFLRNLKSGNKVQKHSDGGGLYIHVTPQGSKLWRMAYRFGGKQKTLSLGKYPDVSLKDARTRRDEDRALLSSGIDPSEHRKAEKASVIAEQKRQADTFEAVALEWFSTYSKTITPKHADRLHRYLKGTLFPSLGGMLVTDIEPSHLVTAIRPADISGKATTAHKLSNLCNQVLTYAVNSGKTRFNAAAGISKALQPIKVESRAAITEPKAVGQLLRDIDDLYAFPSISYFLKILPYVFTRPSELRLAQWSEFDLDAAMWKIPASRMKMRRDHAVPLSCQVVSLLAELKRFSGDGQFLFPSPKAKSAKISDMGPMAALRRMGYDKETMCLHGFRSMASTLLNEQGYRPDVIESQLAHKDSDAVRLAYNRAEYMEERRRMMQDWADYLDRLREDKG